jgi:3-dehydroquinate dehydratase-1
MKPIQIRGTPVAGGKLPLICAPLVGVDRDALLAEAATVAAAKPDLFEWRVDFFRAIDDPARVIDTARALRRALPGMPLLFTRRSAAEGGQGVPVSEPAVVELYAAVCAAGCVDLIDYEMSNDAGSVQSVREASARHGVGLVLSYHNFSETPSLEALGARFRRAQELGGDVAKVAVMPRRLDDVLTLLSATLHASESLEIPLISMSMGTYGSLTRMIGFAFGSALTFGVGASSSAPGQVPMNDLEAVTAIVRRALGRG